jgi:hypothetical protein
MAYWWRWEELNLRHGAYETPALPLSYTAENRHDLGSGPSVPQTVEARAKHHHNSRGGGAANAPRGAGAISTCRHLI